MQREPRASRRGDLRPSVKEEQHKIQQQPARRQSSNRRVIPLCRVVFGFSHRSVLLDSLAADHALDRNSDTADRLLDDISTRSSHIISNRTPFQLGIRCLRPEAFKKGENLNEEPAVDPFIAFPSRICAVNPEGRCFGSISCIVAARKETPGARSPPAQVQLTSSGLGSAKDHTIVRHRISRASPRSPCWLSGSLD